MVKIAIIVIVFAIIIVCLKSINPEIAMLALVAAGVIVLFLAVNLIGETFDFLNKLAELTGIDSQIFKIIIKITAVGYIVEFSASTVEDLGLSSLAQKLVFVGKLIILSMSLPIIYAVFNMLTLLLK